MIQALAGGLEVSQNGASAADTGQFEALEKCPPAVPPRRHQGVEGVKDNQPS
jgi:hypothetical protein